MDYIKAEHKLQFYLQVIKSTSHYTTSLFSKTTARILSTIFERKNRKTATNVLGPIYIPRALNTGTCIQQGHIFYFAGLKQGKLGSGFGKNSGVWTGRVEINKEEIPGSKRSMHGNILTYSRLLRENL